MSIIAKRPKRDIPPEGVYDAVIADIGTETHEEFGERVRISIDLLQHVQEDGQRTRVFKSCSFNFSAKSALTAAVRDILGRQLTEQEIYGGFDLGRLEGYQVQVVVKHKTSSAGNVYAVADTIIHQASPGDTVTPVSAHPEPF